MNEMGKKEPIICINEDAKGLAQALDQFMDDHVWIAENWDLLLRDYAEQWIAVHNGQVIAGDSLHEGLIAKLADPAHTCIRFITREPMEMIL